MTITKSTENVWDLPGECYLAGGTVEEGGIEAEYCQAGAELNSEDWNPDICGRTESEARVVSAQGELSARANSPHCGETRDHHTQQLSRDHWINYNWD